MALVDLGPWDGAHNAAATTANTGFDSIIKTDTAATMLFKRGGTEWMPRGRPSLEVSGTTTAGYALGEIEPGTTSDALSVELYIKPIALPTSEQALIGFHQVTDGRVFSVSWYPDGTIRVRDGGNTGRWDAGATYSPAGTLQVGVPVIVRVGFVRNATAGSYQVQVVNESDYSVRADSGVRTAQNTGSATITHIKISAKSGSTSTIPAKASWGAPRYDWASSSLIPLWTPPVSTPYRMWIGGAYTPVKMLRYVPGTGYQDFDLAPSGAEEPPAVAPTVSAFGAAAPSTAVSSYDDLGAGGWTGSNFYLAGTAPTSGTYDFMGGRLYIPAGSAHIGLSARMGYYLSPAGVVNPGSPTDILTGYATNPQVTKTLAAGWNDFLLPTPITMAWTRGVSTGFTIGTGTYYVAVAGTAFTGAYRAGTDQVYLSEHDGSVGPRRGQFGAINGTTVETAGWSFNGAWYGADVLVRY